VRDKEVEFYSRMEDWWSPSGPQKQLHRFNKARVGFLRKAILNDAKPNNQIEFLARQNFLDVGCGAGILSEVILIH